MAGLNVNVATAQSPGGPPDDDAERLAALPPLVRMALLGVIESIIGMSQAEKAGTRNVFKRWADDTTAPPAIQHLGTQMFHLLAVSEIHAQGSTEPGHLARRAQAEEMLRKLRVIWKD